MTRRSRLIVGGLVVLLVVLALLQFCRERPRPPSITDRLVQLNRQLLVDSNPRAVFQATICESARLYDALGPDVARESVKAANKRSYTWRGWAAGRRLDSLLGNRTYPAGGKTCDSLNRGEAPRRRSSERRTNSD